jgi:type VI secretion system secreted protein VgrG
VPQASYTQDDRLLALETPLGKDLLLLQRLQGDDAISRPFSYSLELLAFENTSISFKDIVGQKVTISIQLPDKQPRYVNGYVTRFSQGETDARNFTHYYCQVSPWLWFLTRQSDCRIFQNMTVPDILSQVFNLFSVKDFRNSLKTSYSPLEYCVQYRETSFNFVSRLMEEYGIFYYFDHTTKGKHTLVLADQSSALPDCPGSPFSYETAVGGIDDPDAISDWNVQQDLRTGKYTLNDYNFTTPEVSLLANEPTVVDLSASQGLELFDYPGLYTTKDDGDAAAKLRMQEEEATHILISASSNCRGLLSGYGFDLENHYRGDQNTSYILTSVQHSASMGNVYVSGEEGTESYSNRLMCIPSSTAYRPARSVPKPFVQGPQTALVVGKDGEEIWVDNYGRVKVQFYWDRLGEKNEKSSCWIRVSQPWAGNGWGSIWIPRIGQEVIVSFLEGDPDRPLITGRVYNQDQMPPYTLPDYQTRSTFMSRSSKGGGSSNYNELRFEDKMGSEQIFINAEKDMDLRVENDLREYIGNDASLIVEADRKEKIQGDQSLNIIGNLNEKVGQNMSVQIGQSLNEKTGMNFEHEAGQEIYLKGGMNVVIESGLQLTIKAGSNFINIGPTGVTIQGTMVLINSGGSAGSGSGASCQDPVDPDEADDGSKGGKLN